MAAQRAMSRLGPGELTLAEIAREAGVTAGLLVQRFGSKRDLLLALAERFSGGTARDVRGAAARPPLAAGGAAGLQRLHGAAWPSSPAAFARNFAYLQIDLTDPDFRKHLAKHAAATRVELQKLIKEAIDAKELVAGHESEAARAHDRSGRRRLDDELGLLSGRHCHKVDAPRPRRRPEAVPANKRPAAP